MSLFNNKLSKVPLGMLDTDVQNKFTGYDTSLADIATNLLSPGNNLSPCIGDGASDDSATLQAIINYASANGKAVLFPNGKTFVIKNDVNLSNVQLFCLNRGSSPNLILNGGALRITGDNVTIENLSVTLGTNHKKSWLNTDSTSVRNNIVLRNLSIDFNRTGIGTITNTQQPAGFFENINKLLITECIFQHSAGTPIAIQGNSEKFVVSNNIFYDILGNATYGGTSNNTAAGVYISKCNKGVISGNVAELIDDNFCGINGGQEISLTGNTVRNTRLLALVNNHTDGTLAKNITIDGNIATGQENAIMLGYVGAGVSDVVISNNILKNVVDTSLKWTGSNAIKIDGSFTNVEITGNKIVGNNYGINATTNTTSSNGLVISGNDIESTVSHVIYLLDLTTISDIIISGNKFIIPAGSKYPIYGGTGLSIVNNIFDGDNSALQCRTGTKSIYNGNIFNVSGVYVLSTVSNFIISNNQFISTMGITTQSSTPTDVKISDNYGTDQTINSPSPTLSQSHVTKIDSTSNAVNGTLPNGSYIGQRKHIVMVNATNSSTIIVTNHETKANETGTFNAVGQIWLLEWNGYKWFTIRNTCTLN